MNRPKDGSAPGKLERSLVILGQVCLGSFFLLFTSFILLILIMGLPRLDWGFIFGFQSRFPDYSGVVAALTGTLELVLFVSLISFCVGVPAALAIYEFGPCSSSGLYRKACRGFDFLMVAMDSLPSVVFGFIGLVALAGWMFLGRSLLAAILTLAAMAVPRVIIGCRDALETVSSEVRESAVALGSTRWQAISTTVLPEASSKIVSGFCQVMVRISGEAAPLLMLGGLSYMTFLPGHPCSPFAALPVDIYNWTVQASGGTYGNAAAGIILLFPVLLLFNFVAVAWRYRRKG